MSKKNVLKVKIGIAALVITLSIATTTSIIFNKNKAYVLIIAGQSQASGRASNEQVKKLYPDVYNNTFKTKIWIDNLAEESGIDSATHFQTPNPYEGTWTQLNPKSTTRQFLQSEVGTHGIELPFAYEFEKSHPNAQLYIIKFAYGGIPLAHDQHHDMDWSPQDFNKHKRMYWAFVNYVLPSSFRSLCWTRFNYIPLGFIWAQGESDGIATQPEWTHNNTDSHIYLKNLNNFFNSLNSHFPEMDNFKKYIVKCVTGFGTDGSPSAPSLTPSTSYPFIQDYVVPDQIAFCADTSNNAVLIETDSLPIIGKTYNENPHFDAVANYKLANTIISKMSEDPATCYTPFTHIKKLLVSVLKK